MARKEKKYHFIYKTTNVLSGKYYIGMHSTDNLEDGYLGSGTRLRYSINKHGKENFVREILEFCKSREELKNREIEVVNLNEIAKEECINLVVGGIGGFISLEGVKKGALITNEKLKLLRDNPDWLKSVKLKMSVSAKKAIKEGKRTPKPPSFEGKSHSEQTKQLMSEIKMGTGIGETNSQYGTCWITNGIENKKIKKEDLDTYHKEGWVKGRR